MCVYCCGDRYLIDRFENKLSMKLDAYPGISAFIDGSRLEIESVADTYEPSYEEVGIPINYCPMCGDSLNKECDE